jgi:hypothetical protein
MARDQRMLHWETDYLLEQYVGKFTILHNQNGHASPKIQIAVSDGREDQDPRK